MRRLGPLLLLSSLAGCATLTDPLLPHIPVSVRVIHSDRTATGERGHYVYASTDDEQNIRDTADLVTTEEWRIGILSRSQETLEWMAKDSAFRNEADIAVIRPSDTNERLVWHLRVEVWRTKGYTQQIEDDDPKPGFTLIPPPGMTYKTRVRNFEECVSEAATLRSQPLTKHERSLLEGRDTTPFVDFLHHPRRDVYWRPTQIGWETVLTTQTQPRRRLRIPEHATDQYVACLMKRGYLWPRSSTAKN